MYVDPVIRTYICSSELVIILDYSVCLCVCVCVCRMLLNYFKSSEHNIQHFLLMVVEVNSCTVFQDFVLF